MVGVGNRYRLLKDGRAGMNVEDEYMLARIRRVEEMGMRPDTRG
jgi:hypothetical protein